jgi:hypothetical protein
LIPDNLGLTWRAVTQPGTDFSKLPSGWHATNVAPLNKVIQPDAVAPRRTDETQINAKIIIHPSQSSIGVRPPGRQMAQKDYPNLQMLPIESPRSALEAIPIQWPSFKLEAIPIQWPSFKLEAIPIQWPGLVILPARIGTQVN